MSAPRGLHVVSYQGIPGFDLRPLLFDQGHVIDRIHAANARAVGARLLSSEAVAIQLKALALLAVTVFPKQNEIFM